MTDRTRIRRAIARLEPPHLAVIYRAHHLGQSIAQIAAETDTPECVVRATLHDAMRELRRILVDVRVAV